MCCNITTNGRLIQNPYTVQHQTFAIEKFRDSILTTRSCPGDKNISFLNLYKSLRNKSCRSSESWYFDQFRKKIFLPIKGAQAWFNVYPWTMRKSCFEFVLNSVNFLLHSYRFYYGSTDKILNRQLFKVMSTFYCLK